MIKVGLTGNIGSGKSTVAKIFEHLGTPVYYADREARKFFSDQMVRNKLVKRFGKEIISETTVDRKRLAEIVFNDPESLDFLNGLIHPRVRADLMKWMESKQDNPYIVQEAAILFESGFYSFFDKTIFISCPRELAIERIIKRDGVSRRDVLLRMERQWPEEKKIPLSDFVIKNSGNELIIPQVLMIHNKLSSQTNLL